MPKIVENLRKRKSTGGRRKAARGRRAYERDSYPTEPIVGPRLVLARRIRGGSIKHFVRREDYANVTNPETGRTQKTKILRVAQNPANRDYERRGIITQGAILETEAGRARVTSRPGQDGVINAVLIKQQLR